MVLRPPRIVAFRAPPQALRGSKVVLQWHLDGGPPDALTLDGRPVSGTSCMVTVIDDPTCFALQARNAAGVALAERWIGTHDPDDCVSDSIELAAGGTFSNLRWSQENFEHGGSCEMLATAERVAEGRRVRFHVEREDGAGCWVQYASVLGTVSNGEAVGLLKTDHPLHGMKPGARLEPHPLRFSVYLAPADTAKDGPPERPAAAPTPAPAVATQRAPFAEPRWSKDAFEHGEVGQMLARAIGIPDGRRVRFHVERRDGAEHWVPYTSVLGSVEKGVATGTLSLQHAWCGAQGAAPLASHDLRF